MDDFDTPEARRDRGLALVKEASERRANWFGRALMVIVALDRDWTGTGEDIRLDYLDHRLEPAHSAHVYGSLVSQAVKRGLLARTGERRKMRGERSNGRMTDVYRRAA